MSEGIIVIRTQDGTVIARDPKTGVCVSAPTRAEAEAEVRRLNTAKARGVA
jgi:hypothetical protein